MADRSPDIVHNHIDGGATALVLSVVSKKLLSVKFLVRRGANLNVRDRNGNTPAHYAVQQGTLSCLRYLVEKGADISQVNREGLTPRSCAVFGGKKEMVEFFDSIPSHS